MKRTIRPETPTRVSTVRVPFLGRVPVPANLIPDPRRKFPKDEEHQRGRRDLAPDVIRRVSPRVREHVESIRGRKGRERHHSRTREKTRRADGCDGAHLAQFFAAALGLHGEAAEHGEESSAVHRETTRRGERHDGEEETRDASERLAVARLHARPRPQARLEQVGEDVGDDESWAERVGWKGPRLMVNLGPEEHEEGVGCEEEQPGKIHEDVHEDGRANVVVDGATEGEHARARAGAREVEKVEHLLGGPTGVERGARRGRDGSVRTGALGRRFGRPTSFF